MKVCKKLPRFFLASIFAVVVLFAGYNAAAADRSIVVLDMQKALTDSEVGKKAQQAMEKKVAELQEKFKKDEEELLALQEEIEKKSSVWSEEKKQEKAIEYQKKRRDLRVKQDDANLELKQLQEQQLGPILKEMEKVVADVAKKKGYKIILPKAAVVHTDESVEITTEITEALNGIDN